MKRHIYILIRATLLISTFIFITDHLFAQVDVIEIDTLTANASKVLPYNKPFTLKIKIETDNVQKVYKIPKYRYFDLAQSIGHNIKNSGSIYIIPEIPANYYYVRKIGEQNFLFINFSDTILLKPSSAYFIVIIQPKLDPSTIAFFDTYYEYTKQKDTLLLKKARENLIEINKKIIKIFGEHLNLGIYSLQDFDKHQEEFLSSFNEKLLKQYIDCDSLRKNYAAFLSFNKNNINANFPLLDNLAYTQLFLDTTINKEVIQYISSKDFLINDASNDLNTISRQGKISLIISGKLALGAIFTDAAKDMAYSKRVANIEKSVNLLNNIKKALFLLNPKYEASPHFKADVSNLLNFINTLQSSRDSIKKIISIRSGIENTIAEERFKINSTGGTHTFSYYSVISGDSYLNFETRNKVLLTPDFGVVTSAITSEGKKLDYGIVPYLGFHINLMPVDKDITFSSYKKNWKQYFSVMVGWSLVNMNQDSTYASLFEKSSLLTGVGIRINNVIRVTIGSQWLFKLGKDDHNNPTKNMMAMPYLGLSFDLNIKQYLNGFTDVFSGIGKTKAPLVKVSTNQ